MILHVVRDEKFIDDALTWFEHCAPGSNLAIGLRTREPFGVHVKRTKVQLFKEFQLYSPAFVRLLKRAKAIVFHSLETTALKIFRSAVLHRFSGTVFWLGWGFDYYDLINFERYEPKTKLFLTRFETKPHSSPTTMFNGRAIRFLKTPATSALTALYPKKNLIKRIDYFAPVLPQDYMLIKNEFPSWGPKYVRWNYALPQSVFAHEVEKHKTVGDILVGNSADPNNNHIEAVERLLGAKLTDRKIVIPLSYGDADYKMKFIIWTQNLQDVRLNLLQEFMPLEEYMGIVRRCTHVVMNHRRQQALGNIVSSLFIGAMVFLNENSPTYRFFIENGYHVYSVGDIAREPALIERLLTPSQVSHNRMLVERDFGIDKIKENTRRLINLI